MSYSIVGGKPFAQIVVGLHGVPPVEPDEITRQAEQGSALGLPFQEKNTVEPHGRKLAVVGGGYSINTQIETLKNWDGDIWTINGAYHWCNVVGIERETTFIATDPHEIVAKWVMGVKKALIASRSHPSVFKILQEQDAEVTVFSLDGDRQLACGSSTASAGIHLGIMRGYRDITFFGCESSYTPGYTHGYMNEERKAEMIVRCNDEEYYTAPDYLMQAIEMAGLLRMGSDGLHEESGGLLRAMMESPEYSVMWVSDGMWEMMRPVEQAKEIAEEERKKEDDRKKLAAAHAELAAWPCEEVRKRCEDVFDRERSAEAVKYDAALKAGKETDDVLCEAGEDYADANRATAA